jgi:coenzyme F420-0:L-glutamate ligase/coenzyme F420-1:gamma-L-glutamate ligase
VYPDAERAHAEREMFLLSGGAAIQSLLLALHAQGFASCWVASTLFCQEESREALGMGDEWFALGTVAVGPMPAGAAPPRPPLDLSEYLRTE